MSIRLGLALAVCLLGGCAQGGPSGNTDARLAAVRTGQCFRAEAFANVNIKDDGTAYVATRQGYVYRLDTEGECFNGATSLTLAEPWLNRDGLCTGERTAVIVGKWRAARARQCVATISGPVEDSRDSGLWSRLS